MKVFKRTLSETTMDGFEIIITEFKLEDGEDIEEFMVSVKEACAGKDWLFIPGGAKLVERKKVVFEKTPVTPKDGHMFESSPKKKAKQR